MEQYEKIIEEIDIIKKLHQEEIDRALKLQYWLQNNILDCVQRKKDTFFPDTIQLMGTQTLLKLTSNDFVQKDFHKRMKEYVFTYFGERFEIREHKNIMKTFLEDIFYVSVTCKEGCED